MKIAIFGDSITNGFGMDEGGSSDILKRLIEAESSSIANMPELKIELFGMNGDDSYGAQLRLKYVAEAEADLNFVFFGANDASPYILVRPVEFKENLSKIVERLGRDKTVLITPPFYNEDEPMHYSKLSEVELFRIATLELAAELGLPVIDIFQIMLNSGHPKDLLRPDGLHFTEEAYELLSREILRVIERN